MKKVLAVLLICVLAMAVMAGCGERANEFDPSALQKQIDEMKNKIDNLEDENKKMQEEIDRANAIYDWENPIVITDATAIFEFFNKQRSEFDRLYYGKVFEFSGTYDRVENVDDFSLYRINSIRIPGDLRFCFFHAKLSGGYPSGVEPLLEEHINKPITVRGVYIRIGEPFISFSNSRFMGLSFN